MPPVVSVIMPMDRAGTDALRAAAAVLSQRTRFPFELIVVSPDRRNLPEDSRLRWVEMAERNPAIRRNAAAAVSAAKYLAFIDDDAFADERWLETAVDHLETHPGVVAVGGPDPAPDDSSVAELFSDTLLATRSIGSGIAAHESRPGVFAIRNPWHVALVNFVVRKEAFDRLGGFTEAIGYIGEDTDLVARLRNLGPVVYHDTVIVRHRRRRFPGPYLRQRWRYRVKTGERLVAAGRLYRTRAVGALLGGGVLFLVLLVLAPEAALTLLAIYAILVTALAIPVTRLPARWWLLLAPAFLLHHATYFGGIVTGAVRAILRRGNRSSGESVRDPEA